MTARAEGVAITIVIAAHNEARRITACIASVSWAAEVLVVENDSTDDTVALARAAGASVVSRPFTTIGEQRNDAIARASHDWVLVLDADERATPALGDEVARVIATRPRASAFRIGRRNHFLGREIRHGGWEGARDRPVRLFRKHLRYDARRVHEHVVPDGPVGVLQEMLLHYPYDSLDEYFEKFDRYSRWWAEQNVGRYPRAPVWPVLLKPPARFLSMYLLRSGWLDGAHGAVLASLSAMSVAAKYARLWALARAHGSDAARRPV